ncbi:uncharacterized protein [Eurosta solidaginis]|uniref:uncharacterized protein n=1 Tax=Eurosta solidaginis TaxID=178769 RepID=UPI0035312058
MTGNLVENYFTFFCPSTNHFPLISSIVDDESELLTYKNAVIWSRNRFYHDVSIVSYDFSLYHSSIMALFGIDFHNCAILYGFELKSLFYNILPTGQIFDEHKLELLQLPHLFIMDNDTLKIHNIISYQEISYLNDHSCYVVIMRFITTHILQKYANNYETLSCLFYKNITDLNKYKNRLPLHKNILNSICGMLSAYKINTTILNIVNALSRKIMLWVVDNCIYSNNCNDEVTISFLDHEYDMNSVPPTNLISIDNDSFTYIYEHMRLDYGKMTEHRAKTESMRLAIINKLCNELRPCTIFSKNEIRHVINLKTNFITSNLYYLASNTYFYLLCENDTGTCKIVSNQKLARDIQKALVYLNMDGSILKSLKKCSSIKITHLRRTHNFTETRHLLIWYLLQLS